VVEDNHENNDDQDEDEGKDDQRENAASSASTRSRQLEHGSRNLAPSSLSDIRRGP
jgi:hypothetical protein